MWYTKYLSIPFQANKSSMQSCDCAGLVFLVLQQELGMQIERSADVDYTAREKHILMRKYFDLLEEVQYTEIKEFDIFFQTDGIFHTGVVIDEHRILEATLDRGIKIDTVINKLIKPTKFYRLKKICNQ